MQVGDFGAAIESVPSARAFVTDALHRRVDADIAADAALVATELATNAVLHARSPFSVSVSDFGDSLRVAVRDESPRRPVARSVGAMSSSGRGMHVVSAIATRWGVDAHPAGKVVWAELPSSR